MTPFDSSMAFAASSSNVMFSASEMIFSTISELLSCFSFNTEFGNDGNHFASRTFLPIPEDVPSVLSDYGETKLYTNEFLSCTSTENIFRFICGN